MATSLDERRDVIIPGDKMATIAYSVEHFLKVGQKAIDDHGYFAVALSGGSTPQEIYKKLSDPKYNKAIDWNLVLLFWSDERSVTPNDPESNYHMAMESGFQHLPLAPTNIFRMEAEKNIEEAAKNYEEIILRKIPRKVFDLVMLGMGDDGHVASLFPKTEGLNVSDRLVIANYVPQKETWRMSLTFQAINEADCIAIYVIGEKKAQMVANVLRSNSDEALPAERVGSPHHKALWILDKEAASRLI